MDRASKTLTWRTYTLRLISSHSNLCSDTRKYTNTVYAFYMELSQNCIVPFLLKNTSFSFALASVSIACFSLS